MNEIKFLRVMRRCVSCGKLKMLSKYSNMRGDIEGKQKRCKLCSSVESKAYKRTKKGLISKIYSNQKVTVSRREVILLMYTKQEFEHWVLSNPQFDLIFDKWVDSKYKKHLIPSIDRLDDYGNYELDNIQILTWGENNLKGNLNVRLGINTKTSRGVNQYDMKGGFIKNHNSIHLAGRTTNTCYQNIYKVCSGKRASAGGFKWEYND